MLQVWVKFLGKNVYIVDGDYRNIKVKTKSDTKLFCKKFILRKTIIKRIIINLWNYPAEINHIKFSTKILNFENT